MFSVHAGIFLLSSILALVLVYFSISLTTTQQIIVMLIIVTLLALNKFLTVNQGQRSRIIGLFFLLISSLLVQLVVLSSGGFFSPLLILLHLFFLGTSFLLNLKSSIVFLIFSFALLVANIVIDPKMSGLFKEDPWSVVLYFVSFLIIIPLAQLLTQTYNLKDTITKLLTEHIQLGKLREQSIMKSLNELVIVTDLDLHILSINDAVERTLGLVIQDILNKDLLKVLSIGDSEAHPVSRDSFSINKVIDDKASRIIRNFYIYINSSKPTRVDIQVSPIVDLKGAVNQLAFVISTISSGDHKLHFYLEQARVRHKVLKENLKKILQTAPQASQLLQEVELFTKTDDDLLTALEIEDHSIRENIGLHNVATTVQNVCSAKYELAKRLGVAVRLNLQNSKLSVLSLAAPFDIKWLDLLLRKILDVALLLAYGQNNPLVDITVNKDDHGDIHIALNVATIVLQPEQQQMLFSHYYGDLGPRTNLRLGSGLEGFIAKTISTELNIPLTVDQKGNLLTFKLQLSPYPRHLST